MNFNLKQEKNRKEVRMLLDLRKRKDVTNTI